MTPNELLEPLRKRMGLHSTNAIAKACGMDRETVRKVRNGVNVESLKLESLFKLGAGLDAMNGEADND